MNSSQQMLTVSDHNRSFIHMTYVYVVSWRAGGVSVGINLNPDRACNWHCAYCQVPGLIRGAAPEIDLAQLEDELRRFSTSCSTAASWPTTSRPRRQVIRDIAFSGNGEPHQQQGLCRDRRAGRGDPRRGGAGRRADPADHQRQPGGSALRAEGLRSLATAGGEVWFKLDGGRAEEFMRINGVDLAPGPTPAGWRCVPRCARPGYRRAWSAGTTRRRRRR